MNTNRVPKNKIPTPEKTAQQKAQAEPSSDIQAWERTDWTEVAMIDFTGYIDRDCDERIIYKTPGGELKSARHDDHGSEVLEDVTREQVAAWIRECIVPQEFEKDFAPAAAAQEALARRGAQRRSRELLVRGSTWKKLAALAPQLSVGTRGLTESIITRYLSFVARFPALAQAQPRFVRGTVALALSDELHDQLEDTCDLYRLDAGGVADVAIKVYAAFVARDGQLQLAQEFPGDLDEENIAFWLSRAASPEQCTFAKIANRLCDQDFESACGDLDAFRSLIMHHPGFAAEREALEMITEGANRLWASPAQATWREVKANSR